MGIDAKVMGGLAWAGLALIIVVPATDSILGKPVERASITSDMQPVTPAAPTAAVPVASATPTPALSQVPDPMQTASISGTGNDAVDKYMQTHDGKLPDYISGGATKPPAPLAVTPVSTPAAGTTPATQVASLPKVEDVPPIPMPRSARPIVPAETASAEQPLGASVAPAMPQAVGAAPQAVASQQQPVVIVDENQVNGQQQASADTSTGFFGGQDDGTADGSAGGAPVISGQKLEQWNSGSLAEYLERKGLLSDGAQPQPAASTDDSYDPDGFYLDQGPNRPRAWRRRPPEDIVLF